MSFIASLVSASPLPSMRSSRKIFTCVHHTRSAKHVPHSFTISPDQLCYYHHKTGCPITHKYDTSDCTTTLLLLLLRGGGQRVLPSVNKVQYVTTQANSAFHPSRVGKWVPASAGKAKGGMVHSVSGWMGVCRQHCQIYWERVLYPSALEVCSWQGIYTNPRLPLRILLLLKMYRSEWHMGTSIESGW